MNLAKISLRPQVAVSLRLLVAHEVQCDAQVSRESASRLRYSTKLPAQAFGSPNSPFAAGANGSRANMSIMTAVWLSIPAELRDDWLSRGGGSMRGAFVGDVDGTVEFALRLEQSCRRLTHRWNVINHPREISVDK